MINKIISLGLAKGLKTVEVNSIKSFGLELSVFDGKLEQCVKSSVEVVSIKGLYRGHLGSITVENLDENKIDFYLEELITSAKLVTSNEPVVFYKGAKKYHSIVEKTSNLDQYSIDVKTQKLIDFEHLLTSAKYCVSSEMIKYVENFTKTTLVNSLGLNLTKTTGYAYLMGTAVFQKNEITSNSGDAIIGINFEDFDIKKLAKGIILDGQKKLDAIVLDSGTYDIVFKNDVFSEWFSCFASIFTAESLIRNRTQLKGKENTQIASNIFSLEDNPFSNHAFLQQAFDDQGYPTKRRKIIDNGVFMGFINNLKFAKMTNQKPTGHANNGINFINPEIASGKHRLKDLLKIVQNGFFVTGLEGLHASVNSTSGAFQAQANGFLIKDGVLSTGVKLVVISGNFFEVLKNISHIANDSKMTLSGYYNPSIHIGKLSVAGK